jgi:outer membrane protein TolC
MSVILFLVTCGLCGGVTDKPLTLDDCIKLARDNNEVIKMQLESIFQARQRKRQAEGEVLPSLSFTLDRFFRDKNGNTVMGSGTDSGFSLTQPIFYGGQNLKALELSKVDIRIEELQLKTVIRKLDSEVAAVFYTLAQAQADFKNTTESMDMMITRKNDLTERVRLGKSRQSELFMLESQVALLRSRLQGIKGDYAKALESLSFVIGISTTITISDTVLQPQAAEVVDKIMERAMSRSDIQVAKDAITEQSLMVRTARAGYLPELYATGSLYTTSTRSGVLSGSTWDVNLLLDVPLFQGGIIRAQVEEELSKLDEVKIALALATRELVTEIRGLHLSLQSSMAQAAALTDAYDKAK